MKRSLGFSKFTRALLVPLAVVVLIGSFIDTAEAQKKRRYNRYSETGENQQEIDNQFRLLATTDAGDAILDQITNSNIGLFEGAIADYITGNGIVCLVVEAGSPDCPVGEVPDDRYILNENGFPVLKKSFIPDDNAIPFNANLQAQFFAAGTDPLFRNRPDGIAYSFFKLGEPEPFKQYRLYDKKIVASMVNRELAVNNLLYIIENNTLGKAKPLLFINEDGEGILSIGDVLIQNRVDEDVESVPESSSWLGLALVILGCRFVHRRSTSHSRNTM
jgi:hypothetical protein